MIMVVESCRMVSTTEIRDNHVIYYDILISLGALHIYLHRIIT